MRAGTMRYLVEVIRLVETRTPSGGVKKEFRTLCKIRAQKVKTTTRSDADGIKAKEEFDGWSIRLRVRTSDLILRGTHVRIDGSLYKIHMMENDYNRETSLWCNKIDE